MKFNNFANKKQGLNKVNLLLMVILGATLAIPPMIFEKGNTYIVLQIFYKNLQISNGAAILMLVIAGLGLWRMLFNSESSQTPAKHQKKALTQSFDFLNKPVLSPFSLVWLAVFVWGALSYFWSGNSGHYLMKIFYWSAAFMAFYTVNQLAHHDTYKKALIYCILAAAAVIGFDGIIEYTFGFDQIIGHGHPSSTFGNRNVSSHFLVLAAPLALYAMVAETHKNILHTLALSVATMLIFTFIFISTARGPWGAVFISTVVFLAFSLLLFATRKRSATASSSVEKQPLWKNLTLPQIQVFTGLIVVGIILSVFKFNPDTPNPRAEDGKGKIELFNPLSTISGNISETVNITEKGSTNKRFVTWENVAKPIINDQPLTGHGLGSYPFIAEDYFTYDTEGMFSIHNDHLELLIELGLIGGGLVALAFLMTFIVLLRLIFNAKVATADKLLAIAITGALLGSLFNAFFSFPYQHAAPTLLLGTLLGYVNFLYQRYLRAENAWTTVDNKPLQIVFFAALIPSALLILFITFHWSATKQTFETQLSGKYWKTHKVWKNIDYKDYSYNRYVRSMLRTTMRHKYSKIPDKQRAKAALNFVSTFPNASGLSKWGADKAYVSKDYKHAEIMYKLAVEHAPKGKTYNAYRLAKLYKNELKKPALIKPLINDTIKTHGDYIDKNPLGYLYLGRMYLLIGDKVNAMRVFNKGIALHPEKTTSYKKAMP